MTARITAAGYGEPLLRWDLGKNVEFTLQRAGAIAGSVQMPDGIQLPAELKLDLHRQSEPLAEGVRYRINYYVSSSIDEQGRFEFADVPPGTYVVSLQQTQRSPVFAEPSPPIVVPAGARAAELKLPLQRTARLRGVAVDQQDKQPLKDVTLRFYRLDAGGRLFYVSDETTDEEGRFEVYVRPGKVVVEVWGCPPGHLRSCAAPARSRSTSNATRRRWSKSNGRSPCEARSSTAKVARAERGTVLHYGDGARFACKHAAAARRRQRGV